MTKRSCMEEEYKNNTSIIPDNASFALFLKRICDIFALNCRICFLKIPALYVFHSRIYNKKISKLLPFIESIKTEINGFNDDFVTKNCFYDI